MCAGVVWTNSSASLAAQLPECVKHHVARAGAAPAERLLKLPAGQIVPNGREERLPALIAPTSRDTAHAKIRPP
jgi:hypothetical protein